MLGEIFKALLITSLAGSALAAVISLLRPITKKIFGYSWHYYIWLCVLFAMLMPVRFNLKATTTPSVSTQTVQTEQAVMDEQPETAEKVVQADTAQKPQILQRVTVIWNRIMYNRMDILAYVWLAGMVVLLLIYIIGYIRLIHKMHKNSDVVSCPQLMNFTDKRVAVRVWENTSTPFMVGIFKPTLVLPDGELSGEQLDNIIRHEMTHFKRHDILYKWFAELVKCVHWFNPAVWYVSKQIAAECEISCDMAVTKNMSGSEKMSYINTILSLLPKDKSSRLSLTTQMASSKKVLKRRFTMIKNRKTTSSFMSVLSAVIAAVMLSTTVFASGVLSDMTTDDYTIEILNNGEKIELSNKPFIENGEAYVPLRETLEKAMPKDKGVVDIQWDDGTIDVIAAYYQGESGKYQFRIGGKFINLQHISYEDYKNNSIEKSPVVMGIGLQSQSPILKNSTTYVPLRYVNYMLYGYTNRRDENNELYELDYIVYDKNGEIIALESNPINSENKL